MAIERLPAYVKRKRLAGGKIGYFWERPSWAAPKLAASNSDIVRRKAIRNGRTCPVESTPLGSDPAEAITKGTALNAAFREWREGVETKPAPGSVRWLFAWYREQDKFNRLKHKTRKGYQECMDAVEMMAMKVGTLGSKMASSVDGPVADKLYEKAKAKHGVRQGSYMMQVCRLVWNHAGRPGYSKVTGVKHNPFAAMGIEASSGHGKGNRPATRAEYNLYRETARRLGMQSMATAAAICFEGCQRVWDVFGFEDPDGRVPRGIYWDDYIPGERISLIQSKTGKLITLPLTEVIDGERVPLYPELEEELARMPRPEGHGRFMIVRRELDQQPYPIDYMPKKHSKIRREAGLPADFRFTGFRHGGLTEIGDADVTDSRAVSGHSKVDTTLIYNKANMEKARRIAARRREHIAMIEAEAAEPETV